MYALSLLQAPAIAGSLFTLALVVALLFLFVLGILLPVFVWRISVHASRLDATARRIASDLEGVRREARAARSVESA